MAWVIKAPAGCAFHRPFPLPAWRLDPFFHSDFEAEKIKRLIADIPGKKVAGLCLVAGGLDAENLYAFRVDFDSTGRNLVKNSTLNVRVPKVATIYEISNDPATLSVVEMGDSTWRQPEAPHFVPDMPVKFVFVDVFTLNRLLAIPDCQKIRFRKTMVYATRGGAVGAPLEKFTNYIVESLPSFDTKLNQAMAAGSTLNLAAEDVTAYSYGQPCPPHWIPSGISGISGCSITPRTDLILIGNGLAITMGAIDDALWKNVKARELLVNWKRYERPIKFTMDEHGAEYGFTDFQEL